MKNPKVVTPQSDLIKIEGKMLSTKTVVIGYSKTINMLKYIGYKRIKPMKDLRMIITEDPSEEHILMVSAFNSFLEPKYKKMINRHLNHVLQGNIYEPSDMEASRLIALFYSYVTTGKIKDDFADMDDYVSSNILRDHPYILTPELSYFSGPLYVVSIGFGISLLCLGIEVLYNEFGSQRGIIEV